MSDRCYMQIICRKEDKKRFELLGFVAEASKKPNHPLTTMVDEEANYAHVHKLPTNIPYSGFSAPGGTYGSYAYACDGQSLRDIETGQEGGYVVGWDEEKNAPNEQSLEAIRQYRSILKLTQARFTALVQSQKRKGKQP